MLLAELVHFKNYVDIYASFVNYSSQQKFPGGYSPIKVTGVLVVPFRGLNLWIGNAYGTKT